MLLSLRGQPGSVGTPTEKKWGSGQHRHLLVWFGFLEEEGERGRGRDVQLSQGSALPTCSRTGILQQQQQQVLAGAGGRGFAVRIRGKSPVLEAACGYCNSFNTIKNQ